MAVSRDRLRNAALLQRRQMARADCVAWSRSIQAKATGLSCYRTARSVALYSPIQNEVEIQSILAHALSSGKRVFYPKLGDKGAPGFTRICSLTDLVAGRFGILEPAGAEAMTAGDRDALVVFVPGVLFDRLGNRLGRGGGWYDRALHELGNHGVFVGLAYEFQVVDSLPAESWDRKVHFIITESQHIDCGQGLQPSIE